MLLDYRQTNQGKLQAAGLASLLSPSEPSRRTGDKLTSCLTGKLAGGLITNKQFDEKRAKSNLDKNKRFETTG